jgi:hypothetical protein
MTIRNTVVHLLELLLVPYPTPKMKVCYCLFNIFLAIIHVWRLCPPFTIEDMSCMSEKIGLSLYGGTTIENEGLRKYMDLREMTYQ